MKEYIVTKDILNIRSSASAETDDNFIGQLSAGETLYLTDDEIIGVMPHGGQTNIWKTDNLNRLVSLDGVRLKTYADRKAEFIADKNFSHLHGNTDDETQWKINWGFVDLELWKMWENGLTGKDVTIAVVDTGISANLFTNNTSFNDSLSYNVINGNSIVSPDNIGHGNNVAGLIISSGTNGFYGIAPDCDLIMIQANTAFGFRPDDIAAALEHLINMQVDIISLSLISIDTPRLAKAVADCLASGKIILSSNGDPPPIGGHKFPAAYTNVISVGAYMKDTSGNRLYYPSGSIQSDYIKITFPGNNLLDFGTSSTPNSFNMTSASTALACGAFALILSGLEKSSRPTADKILNLMPNACELIDPSNGTWNSSEGYGVLAPKVLYELLIN